MSDLTSCNYCTLKSLKKRYGDRLIPAGPDFIGMETGQCFYVLDEAGDEVIDGKRVKFLAWFMAIPESCLCIC